MKRLINIFTIGVILGAVACSKGSPATTPPPNPNPPSPPVTDTTALNGSFTNGAHITTGQAVIKTVGGVKKLFLENFKTDAGPDLYVYLATNKTASTFINLGLLKATTGNQEYSIGGSPDFTKHRYVLIWCQQFGVLFGSAEIK